MEYVDYFLSIFFRGVLPNVALLGLGGYLEYKYGAIAKTKISALVARVEALEASAKAKL